MLDLGSIRAHLRSVTSVAVSDGEVRTDRVESSEITSFACEEHPDLLWNGAQWREVVRHLVTVHGQVEENGGPASHAIATDSVEVSVEPPADQ